MRKQPTQKRAQLTLEAVYQATAELVDKEGIPGLTTNKIASKAGFSVGTIYQYFSSKEELFRAMVKYSRETALGEINVYLYNCESLDDPASIDLEILIRGYIAILIDGFAFGPPLRRIVTRLCWMVESPEETAETMQALVVRLVQFVNYIQHPQLKLLTETRCFVLSRTIIGCLRSASLERLEPRSVTELTNALVEMVMSQLDLSRQPA
ncbi:MAG: TetR/AcrR family transcriptional regulator [Limnohabitans sp.]|nr:TetR/AcrR family transcriptional regulator [Limnohabitans sp.]